MGSHSAGNDALQLRNQIHEIVLMLQQQLTAIAFAEVKVKEASEQILALRTNNDDVITAAGWLQNLVGADLERTKSHLATIVVTLENYRDRL